ncbi:hypothetical protein BpHYR1_037282 [Brachionus plicatilis]|uniref:Uncharacterized protein n=1 Tax=Brachionus plicatilis TaxID=10195 RepID=A0A3M7QLA8_BRAPC|nr:hypothetical protein BpHYR1_037282 [Brachionus plicatilis]
MIIICSSNILADNMAEGFKYYIRYCGDIFKIFLAWREKDTISNNRQESVKTGQWTGDINEKNFKFILSDMTPDLIRTIRVQKNKINCFLNQLVRFYLKENLQLYLLKRGNLCHLKRIQRLCV